jgi:hypothetical protein
MTTKNLGIISIATNKYIEYWNEQATSLNDQINEYSRVSVFVFTDRVEEALSHSQTLDRLNVKVVEIPNYGWPDATLLRYQIMKSNFSIFSDQDVLVYLDADMRVVAPLDTRLFFKEMKGGVNLVRHPGYFRDPGLNAAKFYFRNPLILFTDLYSLALTGGLGSWDTNAKSEAFVERRYRNKYYCGGIWWGLRDNVHELVSKLALDVETDSRKDVIAKWHDESHLNHWASTNVFSESPPTVCYEASYPWLANLKPLIIAVDKGDISR